MKRVLNESEIDDKLDENIHKSCWIDGLHHQVRVVPVEVVLKMQF